MTTQFNINGQLVCSATPLLMAIINATDDSFYAQSRCTDSTQILAAAEKALSEGADILDIGGCSTRPGSTAADLETEWQRVDMAIGAIRSKYRDTILSLDTFRAEVADRAIIKYGSMIINDISGCTDNKMAEVAAKAGVPYVLTYSTQTSATTTLVEETIDFFVRKSDILQTAGVIDIILDPGFGFGKDLHQNWLLLSKMNRLHVLGKPILVGISRKRMIQQTLNCTQDEALNGTTATNMAALCHGADILRVHDVKEAKQTIMLFNQLNQTN